MPTPYYLLLSSKKKQQEKAEMHGNKKPDGKLLEEFRLKWNLGHLFNDFILFGVYHSVLYII